MKDDENIAIPRTFTPVETGQLSDDRDLMAVVRRYERLAVDVDQRLKDIVLLLNRQHTEQNDTRERIDQLERDIADHVSRSAHGRGKK